MKRILAISLAVLLIALTAAPAVAYGHHRGVSRTYEVCGIEDCALTGIHVHSGTYCTPHYYGDGHDYHEYCEVSYCAQVGYHEHNGSYCFEQRGNVGRDYNNGSYRSGGRGHCCR